MENTIVTKENEYQANENNEKVGHFVFHFSRELNLNWI